MESGRHGTGAPKATNAGQAINGVLRWKAAAHTPSPEQAVWRTASAIFSLSTSSSVAYESFFTCGGVRRRQRTDHIMND